MALKTLNSSPNSSFDNESNRNKRKEKKNKESSQINKAKSKVGKNKKPEQNISTLTTSIIVDQVYVPNSIPLIPVPVVHPAIAMASYFQSLSCPLAIQDWSPIMHAVQPSPIYTLPYSPLPVTIITPRPVFPAPISPYTCPVLSQITTPMVTSNATVINDVPTAPYYMYEPVDYATNPTVSNKIKDQTYHVDEEKVSAYNTITQHTNLDALEDYLLLPKDLFPTPRMHTIDPNTLIDEFCKVDDIHQHAPWILDLEFGIPRAPITRPLPVYDVKYNRIHCKNSPNAIHPGFESCSQEFKRVILFHYDCIVSSWYRGYRILKCDASVENFQAWLLVPMQVLGMCWP